MRKLKKFLPVLLCLLLIFSLTACSDDSQKANSGSENGAELEDFTIILDWYPNAVHSFIYLAMENGYYEEEGLNVVVQFPSSTNDAISLTAAGQADAGMYYMPDVIASAANQNVPVKAIGSIVQQPLNIVISLKESNIDSFEDMVGKKLGYDGLVLNEVITKSMLEDSGHSIDDIEMIDVGFDLMSSLTTGNVDAIIGGYINHELPSFTNQGFDVNYIELTEGGVPSYHELVLVTGQEQINNESDKLAAFIRASKRGFADMKADPQNALAVLLKYQDDANYPLDENVEKQSLDILLPMMETAGTPFLGQDSASWQEMIQWLLDKDYLTKEIKAEDVVAEIKL